MSDRTIGLLQRLLVLALDVFSSNSYHIQSMPASVGSVHVFGEIAPIPFSPATPSNMLRVHLKSGESYNALENFVPLQSAGRR